MIDSTASRQEQILTLLLNASEGMSIDEIAGKLTISRTAVKQHLVGLEKQQFIREAALNSTGGRPARNYALTELGRNRFPKQYAWFCNLLLEELAAEMDTAALEGLMWRLGGKLGDSLRPQFAGKDSAEKLAALVDLMQKLGYHAEIEAQEAEPSIKAVNCVFHDLAQKHPEICHFDQALISTLLDKPIQQTACMARQDCACRFKPG